MVFPVVAEALTPEFLASVAMSPPLKVGKAWAMQFRALQGPGGAPLKFYLATPGTCEGVALPLEPSVFRGSGDEPRKNIVFNVPDATREAIEALEERARELAELSPAVWNAATKPGEQYPPLLKAKINVAGPQTCPLFDAAGQKLEELPDPFVRCAANALVWVQGV